MTGYIGNRSVVAQVDGYNRSEADDQFVDAAGDTMTGNLTMSGSGIYLGGTGAANLLDDYEEGDYQVTISGASGTGTISGNDRLVYTKVGRIVHVTGFLGGVDFTGTGLDVIFSLPFSVADVDGSSAKSRLNGSIFVLDGAKPPRDYLVYPSNSGVGGFGLQDASNSSFDRVGETGMGSNLNIGFSITYVTL